MSDNLPPTGRKADQADPEKKVTMQVYAALGATIILSVIPNALAAVLCMVLGLGVLVAAYSIRKKADDESLSDNHMTFVIRTIWIGSFLFCVTSVLAAIYASMNLDYTALEGCAGNGAASVDALLPCLPQYIEDNQNLLINSMVYAGLPIFVYFGYRFIKGLGRASKGYRIASPKGWF